jgi:NADPH-dependent 2,4-dienoyl-CoA reductase/sulfur reductase-like enzyme
MKETTMKVVIVGGVAGEASCAARLRRLDEKAEILMVERGPYVSYANCGLPYHVGGVIEKEASLILGTEQTFAAMFNIQVRTGCEAIAVDAGQKIIRLKNVKTGEVTNATYDKLVLSPGAVAVHPPLPGVDLPGIFHVRTVPDAKTIREWVERGTTFLSGMFAYSGIQALKPARRAVVVGGGFIGLETAENLVHLGFDVTLVQKPDQLLGPMDGEMARLVELFLTRHGIRLVMNDGVAGFQLQEGGALHVLTSSGKTFPADIAILAIGVKPDTALAKSAGIAIGECGGIRVDEQMRTSQPDIFAVGDAIEVKDFVTGRWSLVALAGPANRQGRIAADVIAGRKSRFSKSSATPITKKSTSSPTLTPATTPTPSRLP